MSNDVIEVIKKERVTICDICGGQIDPEEAKERELVGQVLGDRFSKPAHDGPATTKDKIFRFKWPGDRRRKDIEAIEEGMGRAKPSRYNGPYRDRSYDFHADCLLNLVEAAIEHRKAAAVVPE